MKSKVHTSEHRANAVPQAGDELASLTVPVACKVPLTVEQIKEWVDVYRGRNKGDFPSTRSGPIFNADGSDTGQTWSVVHAAFFNQCRGLKDTGFTSLSDFLNKIYPTERAKGEPEKKFKPDDINPLLNLI